MLWAIIGLPGSGKTTLFQLLSHREGDGHYKKDSDVTVVKVEDERLERLAEIYTPQKITPAEIEFMDIAGQIGKSKAILGELQRADGLVCCVRAFDSGFGRPTPDKDAAEIYNELSLFDIEIFEHKVESIDKLLRAAKPTERQHLEKEKQLATELSSSLEGGSFIRDIELTSQQRETLSGFGLLTDKPILYVLNCDEEHYRKRDSLVASIDLDHKRTGAIALMAQMELELGELDNEDSKAFRKEMGIEETVIETFIKKAYNTIGAITFFTGSEKELHAWTIAEGTSVVEAAGKIHSDMARGFIRAEVIHWKELCEVGSLADARSRGLLRQEGKGYIVKDGEVIQIKFAV